MTNTEEQVAISDEQFEGLFKMVQSTDQENAIVALHVMENCDFRKSLGKLLYLYKHSKCDKELWKEHAPKLTSKLVGIGITMGEDITFETAFKILAEEKASADSFQFLMTKFGNVIRDEIASWGYDWIESIEIKIRLKDETSRQLSEGE